MSHADHTLHDTGFKTSPNSAVKAVVHAWLAAGALDILAAFATLAPKGVAPLSILKSIASGVLGAKAFRGGLEMAALGLALHFAIMLGIAGIFWIARGKLRYLREEPLISGLAYGVAVYAFMNLVVLPLSAIPFKPDHSMTSLATGLTVHMLCVGLPIALIMSRLDVKCGFKGGGKRDGGRSGESGGEDRGKRDADR